MKVSDFSFELPEGLIAHHPAPERTASRLLKLGRHTGSISHHRFAALPTLLRPGDLLVFNDTRVIPARLFGRKAGGGKVEVLLERMLPNNAVLAQVRGSKSLQPGNAIHFESGDAVLVSATVSGREDGFLLLQFPADLDLSALFERIGHMPLPPYIKRDDTLEDQQRYQTVYASRSGAVAAPTAGLHFDNGLLATLRAQGVDTAFVTLHVGAGTFQPVRVENIEDHRMHAEYLEVSEEVCTKVRACRACDGRVVAVGTTSVRCLETASQSGIIQPYVGDTRIFIHPGYQFRSVDALITNFHLPESTLLMLVSAFSTRDFVLEAYRTAIAEQYRFYSYGDAMLIV